MAESPALVMLRSKILSGEIHAMHLIYMSTRIMTRSAVRAQDLSRLATVRIDLPNLSATSFGDKVAAELAVTRVSPKAIPGDIRYELIFESEEQKDVATIYIDGLGRSGLVDGTAVDFSEDLGKWLKQTFGAVLE